MKSVRSVLCVAGCLLWLAGCVAAPATEAPSTASTEATTVSATTTASSATEATTTEVTDPVTAATTVAATKEKTTVTTEKTTATTQKPAKTADPYKGYDRLQLIRDPAFHNGFIVDSHEVKNAAFLPAGTWKFNDSAAAPLWDVNNPNWASYRDRTHYVNLLLDNVSKEKNALWNGLCGLTYNAKNDSMIFRWDSFDWYGGEGHDPADGWPGMILGTTFYASLNDFASADEDERDFYRCDADKLIFSMDVRLTDYRHEWHEGINDCQFILFFYVHSARGDGFIWFGVPLFDDNYADESAYFNDKEAFFIDADSGCYIYDIPVHEIFSHMDPSGRPDFFDAGLTTPEASDEWLHLELDLRPWIDRMAAKTIKGSEYNVFPQAKTVHDLYFSGMNIGYEVHGSYKCDFEVRNMSLTSYFKR